MDTWEHPVIAQRELHRNDTAITVSIGLPYREFLLWYAPFRIDRAGDDPVLHSASGRDSLEAFQSAERMIGAMVHSWNADGAITWDGERDLGFR